MRREVMHGKTLHHRAQLFANSPIHVDGLIGVELDLGWRMPPSQMQQDIAYMGWRL
jgi:hypothetical protein